MRQFYCILFLLVSLVCISVNAQKVDSIMGIYADSLPQEKVHIHFDKSLYTTGETIWYKAYIMADLAPTYLSKNFYIDWFDTDGKLLLHSTAPIYQASTRGKFDIPADYKGKTIHVKAYTKWMLNFDTTFLFNKDVSVNQVVTGKKINTPINYVSNIHFFPEGGDLVNDLESRVAFLVTNQFGKPVTITGAIKNEKGEVVDSFATDHDGMGSFSVTTTSGNIFSTTWTDEYGAVYNTTLPKPKSEGVVMQVKSLSKKVLFAIKRLPQTNDEYKTLYVVGHINQHMVYKSKINFLSTSVLGEIPTADLPTGILQLTIFNANWMPIAERIVFVNNYNFLFNPDLQIVSKGLAKRQKNVFEITVPNDSVLSNMSIAVTDADLYNDNSSHIVSQFLLNSDLKGVVYNSSYYFSSKEDSVKQHLDLVMLTHGWRRFNWDNVVKGIIPTLKYVKDSDYLQIKGKVFGRAYSHLKEEQSINLILQSKDNSKKFIYLDIAKSGEFIQRGVFFYDTLKAYYQFNGQKRLTDVTTVTMNAGLLEAHTKRLYDKPFAPYNWLTNEQDSTVIKKADFYRKERERIEKLLKAQQLDEVTVRTKAKSAKDILDEKYSTGLFAGGDAYQFDLMNDPFAQASTDVFSYLQGRVAGLQITTNGGSEPSLSWRGGRPSLFLDEIPTTEQQLQSISMNDVAYVKVMRPPFFGATGGGEGGAIAVYTRKGEDVKFTPGEGMGFALLAGYTPYKEFYSPDYAVSQPAESDLRTTIYWNPYLLTNPKSKTVKVEFYNNDVSKRLRVVLEGVNTDGKLARVEQIVE